MITNNTYNMSITGEVSPQNKEVILNDQLNTNAGSNSATGNDDASHEGVNIKTTAENPANNTESEEVLGTQYSNSNSVKGGEGMEKRTRKEYDGSYAHGVTADLEHVSTITAYDNAVERLNKRRTFLVGEYKDIAASYSADDRVSERAKLLKTKATKEAQIKTVNKTLKTLSALKDEIEETERTAQAVVEFIDFDAA